MANLNRVLLIGRLTRDPEAIANGKGTKFGFACNNRKFDSTTQKWEDVPVFVDCECWDRGEQGKNATRLRETVRKGQQLFIEGHLKLDTWEDKNGGGKRTAIRVVIDSFQYLEAKSDGQRTPPPPTRTPQRVPQDVPEDTDGEPTSGYTDEDIPF